MKSLINCQGHIFQLIRMLVLAAIIIVSSCSKSNGPDNGDEKFLTCKINGKQHTFNYSVNANSKPPGEKIHFVVISGWEQEDVVKSPGFGIELVLPEGAEEKTYSVAGGSKPELDGQYYIQNYNGNQHTGTTVYDGGRGSGTSFMLTITSLTSWGVKGTFSGVLKLTGGDQLITITDGKFSAPYNF